MILGFFKDLSFFFYSEVFKKIRIDKMFCSSLYSSMYNLMLCFICCYIYVFSIFIESNQCVIYELQYCFSFLVLLVVYVLVVLFLVQIFVFDNIFYLCYGKF